MKHIPFVITQPNGHISNHALKRIFNFQQPKWTLIIRESISYITEQQSWGRGKKGVNACWLLKRGTGVENASSKIFSANRWCFLGSSLHSIRTVPEVIPFPFPEDICLPKYSKIKTVTEGLDQGSHSAAHSQLITVWPFTLAAQHTWVLSKSPSLYGPLH